MQYRIHGGVNTLHCLPESKFRFVDLLHECRKCLLLVQWWQQYRQ